MILIDKVFIRVELLYGRKVVGKTPRMVSLLVVLVSSTSSTLVSSEKYKEAPLNR